MSAPLELATPSGDVGSSVMISAARLALAGVFLVVGAAKVLDVPVAAAFFRSVGMAHWIQYGIGGAEVVGAVLLAVPGTAALAALGLIGLMVGAAGTEVLMLHRLPIASVGMMAALVVVLRSRLRVRRAAPWRALGAFVLCAIAVPARSTTAQDSAATARSADSAASGQLPSGSFTYSLVPDSSDNVKAAVNRTVEHMNFITRPIARSRLNKINPTPQHVSMQLSRDTVSAAFDAGRPIATPRNGETVPWLNELSNETDHAHMAVAGDTVRETIAAPDGTRENAFIFLDGGARLRLRVTVTSHRLPQPLVYELLFRRDAASLSSSTP